jgi:hypothetical protein
MVKTKPYIKLLIIAIILVISSTIGSGVYAEVNNVNKANADTTCPYTIMIGARGSGGPQTGDKSDNYTGVSGPVYGVYKKLEKKLSKENKTIKLQAVQYPAISLQVGVSNPTLFIESIKVGADNMVKQTEDIKKSCPKTKVILAGFSQGAMVVYEASSKAPVNVAGLLLISNGYRSVEDKAIFKGTGLPKNQGVAHGLIPVPKPLTGKPVAINVCLEKDIVCDQTGSISNESSKIHSQGYLGNKIQNQQANTLIKIMKKFKIT